MIDGFASKEMDAQDGSLAARDSMSLGRPDSWIASSGGLELSLSVISSEGESDRNRDLAGVVAAEELGLALEATWKRPSFGDALQFAIEQGFGGTSSSRSGEERRTSEGQTLEAEGVEADRGRARPALTKSQCEALCEALQLGYLWVPWRPLVPWWDAEYPPEKSGQLVLLAPWAKMSWGSSPARSLPSSVLGETPRDNKCIIVQSWGQRARVRGTLAARSTASTARSEGGLTRGGAFRKFTGKEEEAEVGLTYFGKRYLNAYLGRWISADPLAIHAPGEADLNIYAYVSGSILKNVDPLGLEEEAPGAGGASDGGPSGAEGAPSGPEPDEQSYLDACANGACVLAAPDQAVPAASPRPAPISLSIPRLSQGPFAKARDQLIQQAQKADNGLEKATGYTLDGFMAGPASIEDGLRGVANAPSKAEEAGQHWARAAEFEAQCENGEALVEKLKAVESFADALSAGLGAASFATSRGGDWPADDGFLGPTRKKGLAPGTLVDRYGGKDTSTFFAPPGTPLEARALRYDMRVAPLRTFEVQSPLQVRSGLSAPWFGQIGLGTQYKAPMNLKDLIDAKILREVTK